MRCEVEVDCERARKLIINLYINSKPNDKEAMKGLLKHLGYCKSCSRFLMLTKEEWVVK